MCRCSECGSDEITRRPAPGVLDESFGPLGKHLFVPQTTVVVCRYCGIVAWSYFGMGVLCDVVRDRHHGRN